MGAAGQLGRALIGAAPADAEVTALDRTRLDLTDTDAIRTAIAAARPDVVFNAAAYTAVDRAEGEPELARAVNATAVGAMAEALDATGGRLVHVSTDFVFDGQASTPYAPDAACSPLSVYGATKRDGEIAAGSSALVVRTSWVHAAGGANFVRTMIRLMHEKDSLGVVADQIGSPTWAPGLASALWRLAALGATGILHHRDAGVASWYDFAVAIQEEALAAGLLDRAIPIRPIATADYPTPARRPAFSLLDTGATRALLGEDTPHWRENLRAMLKEEAALG